jgi:hypothetical protein
MNASRRSIWTRIGVIVPLLVCGLGVRAYGFAGGTGEPNNPYQIATVADLLSIGSNSTLLSKCFVLVNDIDLDPNLPGGRIFTDALIGRDSNATTTSSSGGFRGVFDGRDHEIRHLCITGNYGHDAGLFGISYGLIQNLHLKDVQVSGSPCGGLVGLSGTKSMILRCLVTGKVRGSYRIGGLVGTVAQATLVGCESRAEVTGDANSTVGGLVAAVSASSSEIIECRAVGAVTGGEAAGGLIGWNWSRATILRCAAEGQVAAEGSAGGLLGRGFSELTLVDSYARGSVSGSIAGGLIGDTGAGVRTYVLNCYAACEAVGRAGGTTPPLVGGLFGERTWMHPTHLVDGCFWDAQRSGIPVSTGLTLADFGMGLTTPQMQQQTTFAQAGWDLGSTWTMPEGGYPILQWEVARAVQN